MRNFLGLLIAVTLSLGAGSALASPAGAEKDSIEHLLEYVEQSPHKFFRNGEESSGKSFAKRLERKLEEEKSGIATAKQSIERCATISRASGKAYLVKFADGAQQPLGVWLSDELERFQHKSTGTKATKSAKAVSGVAEFGDHRRDTKAKRRCDSERDRCRAGFAYRSDVAMVGCEMESGRNAL